MWGKWKHCTLLMGIQNDETDVGNSIVVAQKMKRSITVRSSNSTSGYTPNRTGSRYSNRHLYNYVQNSIIHCSQKFKTTQVPVKRIVDKPNGIYTYNGILFSPKKEGNSDTCYNMDALKTLCSVKQTSYKMANNV